MSHTEHMGRMYTASVILTALTTAPNEIVSLLASSLSRVELHKLELSQVSSAGIFKGAVELFRGTSASTGGSTGAAITPAHFDGHSLAPASTSVVSGPSTTLNSTANTVRLNAASFDAGSGLYCWEPCRKPLLEVSQRFHARITPQTTAELGGMAMTLTFREMGKVPG